MRVVFTDVLVQLLGQPEVYPTNSIVSIPVSYDLTMHILEITDPNGGFPPMIHPISNFTTTGDEVEVFIPLD